MCSGALAPPIARKLSNRYTKMNEYGIGRQLWNVLLALLLIGVSSAWVDDSHALHFITFNLHRDIRVIITSVLACHTRKSECKRSSPSEVLRVIHSTNHPYAELYGH